MSLLEKYDLIHSMIAFVKDEGNNLISMAKLFTMSHCQLLPFETLAGL
jgi:hypothetical protein